MTGEPGTGGPEPDDLAPEERRALFRVVRGGPSDEEVAALAVVLASVATPPPARPPAARNRWSDPSARFRTPLHPGPGAWKTSTWPR